MSLRDTRYVFAFGSLLEYCLILWCRDWVCSYWACLYVDLLGLLQIVAILYAFADIEFTIVMWQKNYTYQQFLLLKLKSENWGQIKSIQTLRRHFWNLCDLFCFLFRKNGWLVGTLRAYRHVSPSNIAIRGHHQQNTRPHLCLNITWPRCNILYAIVATLVRQNLIWRIWYELTIGWCCWLCTPPPPPGLKMAFLQSWKNWPKRAKNRLKRARNQVFLWNVAELGHTPLPA